MSSSSDSDAHNGQPIPAKKRRIQRACDICRQKRRACDGLRTLNKKCTYCNENGVECIYSGAPTTTKRRNPDNYTEILEARLAAAEELVRKLSADAGYSPPPSDASQWSKNSPVVVPAHGAPRPTAVNVGPGVELATMSIRSINDRATPHGDDLAHIQLVQATQDLSINQNRGFMGKSSGVMLMHVALQMRERCTDTRTAWNDRRMDYWTLPTSTLCTSPPSYVFPPPDVLTDLVSLYFEHTNALLPLLHRPTFMRAFASGLHLRDRKFGAIVLLVCAVASRYSNDPTVFDSSAPLKCGYKYFLQVSPSLNELMFVPPTLYDIQFYCLAVQFLDGSAPQGSWALIGIGLRMAQEVGRHRQEPDSPPTPESELWKRAFWVLVYYDRITSCAHGRTCVMGYDEFDLDLPTDCDDEFWAGEPGVDPRHAFQQPVGRSSRVSFFIALMRVNNILAFTLKLLYSLNKMKAQLAVRDDAWEEHLVAELDSALNRWVDDIPLHLRWDPHRHDLLFFRQSVVLYCHYYHVQMTMHRPFIPMLRAAPTALPSLAICTNAARSCSYVADVWCQRMGDTPAIILLPALTIAGIVLSLNIWSGKRTGLHPQMNTTIAEVQKCMAAIRVCDERWQVAGMFWDVLNLLTNVESQPDARPETRTSSPSGSSLESDPTHGHARPRANKRTWPESDHGPRRGRYVVDAEDEHHSGAGRFHYGPGSSSSSSSSPDYAWVGDSQPQMMASSLPTYTSDLGRVPLPVFSQTSLQHAHSYAEGAGEFGLANLRMQHRARDVAAWGHGASMSAVGDHRYDNSHFVADAIRGPGAENHDILGTIDTAMWANTPTTLGVNDWGHYFGSQGHACGSRGA